MRCATLPTLTELKRKITKNSVHHEDLDYAVDPITGWRFYKRSRANLQTTSSSRAKWDQTHCKTSESPDDWRIFLRVRTGFGCLEKNLQPTDGRCEQYTHKYSTYRVAQHDHVSSREHAWLKSWKAQDCASLCP